MVHWRLAGSALGLLAPLCGAGFVNFGEQGSQSVFETVGSDRAILDDERIDGRNRPFLDELEPKHSADASQGSAADGITPFASVLNRLDEAIDSKLFSKLNSGNRDYLDELHAEGIADIIRLEKFNFGIDKVGNAWFSFKDEKDNEFSMHGLEFVPHIMAQTKFIGLDTDLDNMQENLENIMEIDSNKLNIDTKESVRDDLIEDAELIGNFAEVRVRDEIRSRPYEQRGISSKLSKTYQTVSEGFAASMVMHSKHHASISVWNLKDRPLNTDNANKDVQSINLLYETNSFHITPISHIKEETKTFKRILKIIDSDEANDRGQGEIEKYHFAILDKQVKVRPGSCGAVYLKDLRNKDMDGKAQAVRAVQEDFNLNRLKVEKLSTDYKISRMDESFDSDIKNSPKEKEEDSHSRLLRSVHNEGLIKEIKMQKSRSLIADRWDDCFTDQETPHFLDVGIIADLGYFNSFQGDRESVVESIEVIVANANLIYYFQFNVYIRLRQIVLTTEEILNERGESENCPVGRQPDLMHVLNQDPKANRCCYPIDVALEAIRSLSRNIRPRSLRDFVEINDYKDLDQGSANGFFQVAHWHLLSDCYPPDCGDNTCIVGIAPSYAGQTRKSSVCRFSEGTNIAVSSRSFQTWLTFSHEMGHTLGAPHSFENGIGKTGGIMDYGDGKFKGQYQFNDLRRPDLCPEFNLIVAGELCSPVDGRSLNLNYFSERVDGCDGKEDLEVCDGGLCKKGECLPLQTLFRAYNEKGLYDEYLIEPAEFSPVSPQHDRIRGDIKLAAPINACSKLFGDYTNNIVLVARGGCEFLEKVDHVSASKAIAVVVFNDVDGPPQPIGGEGSRNLPTISISRKDGQQVIDNIEKSSNGTMVGIIGGFPASLKDFPLKPEETLFQRFRQFFVVFFALTGSLLCVYFVYRYRTGIYEGANYAREGIVDAAIENRYRLQDAWENRSKRFSIRPTSTSINSTNYPVGLTSGRKKFRKASVAAENQRFGKV